MQRFLRRAIAYWFVLTIAGMLSATAQDFRQYPGSNLDDKASQQASAVARGMECRVFTTSDSYDKVYAYYKGLYKEFTAPFPRQKLHDGTDVKWAFFILDGGKDLAHSKYWMKIQRPYITTVDDNADFQGIRDISVIQTVRRTDR
jgi:hypothetical protein